MPTRINDRWVWLGFGIFLCLAVTGIQYAVKEHLRSIEVRDSPALRKKPNNASREDDLSLATLNILIRHPNQNIANAAKDIVIKRFMKQPGWAEELQGIIDSPSTSPEERQRARWSQELIAERFGVHNDEHNGLHGNNPLSDHETDGDDDDATFATEDGTMTDIEQIRRNRTRTTSAGSENGAAGDFGAGGDAVASMNGLAREPVIPQG